MIKTPKTLHDIILFETHRLTWEKIEFVRSIRVQILLLFNYIYDGKVQNDYCELDCDQQLFFTWTDRRPSSLVFATLLTLSNKLNIITAKKMFLKKWEEIWFQINYVCLYYAYAQWRDKHIKACFHRFQSKKNTYSKFLWNLHFMVLY